MFEKETTKFIMPYRSLLLPLLFIVFQAGAQIQTQFPAQNQFDAYRQSGVQEKLFLHTDKDFYLAGEICWFKVYYVDASFHRPLDLSKIAYVEVLDKNNKAVLQAKIALNEGDGNGSIYLPATLESGNYRLRSYTNWMKNYTADFFFEKNITIINPQKVYDGDSVQQKEAYDIQFFPEGGNLVNGIRSTIALRITDQHGKGVICDGVVVNEKNDTIRKISTLKFGMGNFEMIPSSGTKYRAILSLGNGKKIESVLPAAYTTGYVMHLESVDNNQLKIAIETSRDIHSAVYLFAHTRGSIKTSMKADVLNGTAEFIVDKNKLGEGISHFTVFNEERQPVCERLYFKYPAQKLSITMKTDATGYELRNKISLEVNSSNQDIKPVQADLSLAVYKLDDLQRLDEMDITNYLWLSSDLSGTVESPSFYFTNINELTLTAMDNLMLTQGWRRFKWEDILHNKKPSFDYIPEYVGHIVNGRVVKTGTGQPAKEIDSYLSVPGTRTQFRTTQSNAKGAIKFEMKDFYNDGEIIVQTNNQRDSAYTIEITSPFSDNHSNKPLPAFKLPNENATTLTNHNIGVQVENVYNGLKQKQFRLPALDTSSFYLKPDITYLLDNYVRFTTMEEVLREYVKPVNVKRRNGKYYFPVFDELRKLFFETDPLLLLDGVPVFDMNKFINYDPLLVRKLEVVSRVYYMGNTFFSGIVNFVTYNGNLTNYELDPHATVIDYDGLQLQREFYSPVYDTRLQAESKLPDFRNLLFWSPNIKTNESGKQNISFYGSDLPGKYVLVIQGITAEGNTGSSVMQIEIREPASVTNK